MDYEFHEIANAFPLLKDTEPGAFAELVDDIKEHGQLHRIILYENKILDGRNRYQACIEAEREPVFKSYVGDDPIGFAISQNLKRRQLSQSQCEAAAAELANIRHGENQHKKEDSSNERSSKPRISQVDAAKKMGVSVAQVKRAAAVKQADPEEFERIKQGKTTTGAAHKKLKPRRETDEALAAAVLDHGKTLEQAATEAGVGSVQKVKIAVAYEQGRRDAVPDVTPDMLAMTAQQKLDTAIKQHKKALDTAFEQRVLKEIAERINTVVLPSFKKREVEYKRVIEARKGIMDRAAYRKILSCLHPDRVSDSGLKKKYEEAFNLFSKLELLLLAEKEMPTSGAPLPCNYNELMEAKRQAEAARRAKRTKTSVAVH